MEETTKSNGESEVKEESRLTSIQRNNVIILLVLTLGSIFYRSFAVTMGVLLGGCIIILNFWFLRKIIEGGFKKRDNAAAFAVSYFFKFAALVAVIFFIIYSGIVNTLALVVGLSTVFISIALDGFIQVLKK
ncbi:MAG: ATP synthase subunit I [Pseudomonadota bacterium]